MQPINRVKLASVSLSFIVACLTVAIFLVVGIFSLHMSMQAKDMNGMICAPGLDTNSSSCMMNPGQHLSWWSHTFSQIPVNQIGSLLLVLISWLSIFGLLSFLEAPIANLLRTLIRTAKDPPESVFHNFLQKYFSLGLAQPILYA